MFTSPSNVLPLHLKHTFPPIIWIFIEGVGDGIESKLPFKIFSTLKYIMEKWTSVSEFPINFKELLKPYGVLVRIF